MDLLRQNRQVADPLQDFIVRTVGGKDAVYALLMRSTHDSDAVRIITAWNSVTVPGTPSNAKFAIVEWDLILEACQMDARELVGVIARCGFDIGYDISKAIFSMKYPRLMEASMEKAIQGDSVERERMHFIAAGHVPGPRGIQIGIVNNNRSDAVEDVTPVRPGRIPSFRATAREVVRDLPPVKALPEPSE